jgi:ligand-binding sensor domain-containing protein
MNTNLSQVDNFLEAENGNFLALVSGFYSYISIDKGLTWQKILGAFDNVWGCGKDSKGNIYLTANGQGVWKSTDNGLSFNNINGTYITDIDCRTLLVDKDDNIWVSSWKNLYYSSDTGKTWTSRLSGLEDYNGSPKGSVIKQNPLNNDILIGFHYGTVRKYNTALSKWEIFSDQLHSYKINSIGFNSKGKIFVGDLTIGIFSSDDNGKTWDLPDLIVGEKMIYRISSFGNNIFIGTGDGVLYKYSSNKNECKAILLPEYNPQSFVMGLTITEKGTILIARSGVGFHRSSDEGKTWTGLYQSTKLLPETFLVDGNNIYAGTRSNSPKGVHKSTDDGLTWQKETGEIETKDIFSLAKNQNGDIFAGTGRQGLYKKTIQSGQWIKTVFPDTLFIYGLVVNDKNELFVGVADGGIFKSNDMGDTFIRLDFNEKVLAMAIVNDSESENFNDIFIGTDKDCFYYNSENEEFEHIPNGFSGKYSRAILYHSQFKKVFAGGMTGGLHALNLSTTSVDENFSNFNLSIYPNPANDYIYIHPSEGFDPSEGSDIQIFDILGIPVSEIHPMTGSHRMNIEHLAPGVYFIKIGNRVEKFVKM